MKLRTNMSSRQLEGISKAIGHAAKVRSSEPFEPENEAETLIMKRTDKASDRFTSSMVSTFKKVLS